MKIIIEGEDLLGKFTATTVDVEQKVIKLEFPNVKTASDGYHSFDELYEHRYRLYIALCNQIKLSNKAEVWRSKKHLDGTMFDDMFIMGISSEAGKMITYHLPLSMWEATNFAKTLPNAYEWDGHTSDDVLERLGMI